jgi:hypothetical protein
MTSAASKKIGGNHFTYGTSCLRLSKLPNSDVHSMHTIAAAKAASAGK